MDARARPEGRRHDVAGQPQRRGNLLQTSRKPIEVAAVACGHRAMTLAKTKRGGSGYFAGAVSSSCPGAEKTRDMKMPSSYSRYTGTASSVWLMTSGGVRNMPMTNAPRKT